MVDLDGKVELNRNVVLYRKAILYRKVDLYREIDHYKTIDLNERSTEMKKVYLNGKVKLNIRVTFIKRSNLMKG
jgi:hypothetical protein